MPILSYRDNDLLFLTLIEFEKACLSEASDTEKGNQKFIQIILTTFPKEGLDLLRSFYRSCDDVKRLRDLLIRAQKFVDAGESVAQKALRSAFETEAILKLQVSVSNLL